MMPTLKELRSGLTQERLRELLHYDPETGVFTNRVTRHPRAKAGDIAGTCTQDGYIQISIDGRLERAHRLAFLWMLGRWPKKQVDHINDVPGDDRWRNLRDASHAENCQNHRCRRDNVSGFKGVKFDKRDGRYYPRITVGERTKSLGGFPTAEAAHAAYVKAANDLFGDFARAA